MTVRTTKSEIDVRSKLAELSKPTGVAGNALAEKDTVEQQQEFLGVGRRNQIINGDFQVSQRGAYSGGLTMVESTYWIDRWRTRVTNSINATATHSLNLVRMEVNANATGSIRIDQKIEIHNSEHLSYKDMTLSALVRSNSTNARLAVYHQGWDVRNTQSSGDGQWERLTLTFNTGSLTVGDEFSIQLGLDGVSSANVALYDGEYMEIKEVQLEFGTTASPFEHRLYGEELALCERFYQKSYDKDAYVTGSTSLSSVGSVDHYGTADATNVLAQVYFRTQMRDAPTVTTYNPNESSGGSAYPGRAYLVSNSGTASYNTTTNNIGSTGFRSYVPRNGGGWTAHRIIFQWQAVAEL